MKKQQNTFKQDVLSCPQVKAKFFVLKAFADKPIT